MELAEANGVPVDRGTGGSRWRVATPALDPLRHKVITKFKCTDRTWWIPVTPWWSYTAILPFRGRKSTTDGTYPTNHQLHETIEITHGFHDWFETGFYIFTSSKNGLGIDWVGDHIRPRFSVPKKWNWPVGLSLSQEIGYQRRQYSVDTWTYELRPIVDKQLGRWYFAFNPAFDKSLHGQNANQGFVFSPNVKISYDFTTKVTGGIEYYGTLGPVTGFDPMLAAATTDFSGDRP